MIIPTVGKTLHIITVVFFTAFLALILFSPFPFSQTSQFYTHRYEVHGDSCNWWLQGHPAGTTVCKSSPLSGYNNSLCITSTSEGKTSELLEAIPKPSLSSPPFRTRHGSL